MTHTDYIKIAMDLALKARGQTSPNPLVGALLVKGGKIIAQGFHRRCGADHAEAAAIKKAGRRTKGASLYVTLEPCSHYGRTPPCVDLIIKSGIQKIFVGMKDPNPLMNGKSIRLLKRAGLEVKVGFLKNELKKMNESFIKYIQHKLPFVVAKFAQTLDGKIATAQGQSKWITAKEARDYGHRLRDGFDAILVGINTVLKDNPFLNAKGKSKRIKKIILDTRLQLPLKANVFKDVKPGDVIVATTTKADQRKLELLNSKNVQVMVCPFYEGRVDLQWLFKELAKMEIASILIEGGGTMIGAALKEKLVDKMMVFIAPKIMGDQKAVSSISGFQPADVNHLPRLKDLTYRKIGDDLLMEGYLW